MASSSLEEHVLNTYREMSYPPFGHFLRILRAEEGIKLKLNEFKSMLLKSGVKYPLLANRRVNRPIRRFYTSLSPDFTWVRDSLSSSLLSSRPILSMCVCVNFAHIGG